MIKIKIKEMAKARGIKNAHRLQLAADLSPAAAARFWKTEIEKISMETLDRLCRTLDCQPGDLFVYVADKEENVSANGHSAEKSEPAENAKGEKIKSTA